MCVIAQQEIAEGGKRRQEMVEKKEVSSKCSQPETVHSIKQIWGVCLFLPTGPPEHGPEATYAPK